jgi:hypothetical protein
MSTQVNHYVIYGYSLPWVNTDHLSEKHGDKENKLFNAFQKYSDSAYKVAKSGSFLVLDDGRDGNHLIIGICIAATEDYGHFDSIVKCEVTKKQKNLLKSKINELKSKLPSYYDLVKRIRNQKPQFYVVSHLR